MIRLGLCVAVLYPTKSKLFIRVFHHLLCISFGTYNSQLRHYTLLYFYYFFQAGVLLRWYLTILLPRNVICQKCIVLPTGLNVPFELNFSVGGLRTVLCASTSFNYWAVWQCAVVRLWDGIRSFNAQLFYANPSLEHPKCSFRLVHSSVNLSNSNFQWVISSLWESEISCSSMPIFLDISREIVPSN